MIEELDIYQFSEKFVNNKYRLELWRYFIANILTDKNLNINQFYVFGSFITSKIFPSDIDLIISIKVDNEELHQYTQKLKVKYGEKLHIYFAYNIEEIDYEYIYKNVIKNASFTNHNIIKVKLGI